MIRDCNVRSILHSFAMFSTHIVCENVLPTQIHVVKQSYIYHCSFLHNCLSFIGDCFIMSVSPHAGKVGFYNEGNSCFLNAALQVLVLRKRYSAVSHSHSGGSDFLTTGEVC